MLRGVRKSIVLLVEEAGQVKETETIANRVACIHFVDEYAFREVHVSVVTAKKKYIGIDCKASNNFNDERTTVHRTKDSSVQVLTYIMKNKIECISP